MAHPGGIHLRGSPPLLRRHDAHDPRLDRALCLDCYDHDHHVVWNHFSGELWRRTKQAIERHLAALCRKRGIPFIRVVTTSGNVHWMPSVRVSHGKVAEAQRRAAVQPPLGASADQWR
jgi:hypothetical protein